MHDKNFYLEKIGKRGKIAIWLVDGIKIRRDLEKEFTNFGQHFRFPVIPEYEFWIDREAVPNEQRFFIDHLLVEWRLMKQGRLYAEAIESAAKKELSERKKAGDFEKIMDANGVPAVAKIHCQLLKKVENKIFVWLVYGRLVRSVFDVNFTEGGHDLVYNYVPKNEVWLDNDALDEERIYILLHELYERSLMERGLVYPEAHKKASELEWQARQSEEKLRDSLAKIRY
ncbi:MAG: hypothetical protein ABIG87_02765 [Patescibacteria group bacterium]